MRGEFVQLLHVDPVGWFLFHGVVDTIAPRQNGI